MSEGSITPSAIKAIEQLVESKRVPMEVKVGDQFADPRVAHVYVNGEREAISLPPPLRAMTATSIDDLVRMCRDQAIAPKPEILVGTERVVVFLNREDRIETAVLTLAYSQRFRTLSGFKSDNAYTAEKLRKLLRFELHGPSTEALVKALEKVDFSRTGSDAQRNEHGKESVGRSIEAQVKGIENFPETFTVSTPVFSNLGLLHLQPDVVCGIHISPQEQAFYVAPLADEIEKAKRLAWEGVSAVLVEQLPDVPIFCGTNRVVSIG